MSEQQKAQAGRKVAGAPALVGWRAYILAGIGVAMAFGLRLALQPLWKDRLPFVTFFVAEFVIVQFVGVRPFLFSVCAGFVLADFAFLPPYHSMAISDRVSQINSLFFFLLSGVLLLFSLRARRALAREQIARSDLAQKLEELRESQARYNALVTNSTDAILMTDREGRILAVNPETCRLFGRTEEELCRMDRTGLMDPADHERAAAAALQRDKDGKVHLELTFVRSDGTKFVGEVSSGVFIDRDGLPKNSSVIRDITERKRGQARLELLHEELVAASRQAGMAEIAANVLHNVGNVLNTVNVSATLVHNQVRKSKVAMLSKTLALLRQHEADLAQFLTSDTKGKQVLPFLASTLEHLESERTKVLEEMDVLRQNVEQIRQIVARQQSYAQVSEALELVDIPEAIEAALRMDPLSRESDSVKVSRHFAEVPRILANRHQFLQILANLVQNARRACEKNPERNAEIVLRVHSSEPKRVRIEVADNGIGIDEANLTRIFSHDFTRREPGRGLGLHDGALAVKQMGGSLVAYSDGLGKGSTFVLELPLAGESNNAENTSGSSI